MNAAPEIKQITPLYTVGVGQGETRATEYISRKTGEVKRNPHPQAGTSYRQVTGEDIAAMVDNPANVEKSKAPWAIFSTYNNHDARNYTVQRSHGEYWVLPVDIDKGAPSLEAVQQSVMGALGEGVSHLIYSSSGATAEDPRWRILLFLNTPVSGADYEDTQNALFDLLDQQGLICDRPLARPGQLVFLPNVPPSKRDEDGRPIFYQRVVARGRKITLTPDHPVIQRREQIRDSVREAERLAAERRAQRMQEVHNGDEVSPATAFSQAHDIAQLFERYGYQQQGRSQHWRSPQQTSGSYATRITKGGSAWTSLSGSDQAAGLGQDNGTCCWGDAFDLYVFYEHGGDFTEAVRTYGEEIRNGGLFDVLAGFRRVTTSHKTLSQTENEPEPDEGSETNEFEQSQQSNEPEWPEPDLNIGQPIRPVAPVMTGADFEHVFGPWAGWIRSAAEVKNVPTDYVALSLLSASSAAIGNSRWAVPWDGWKEPPVLWTMLVGDPSAGKSPALDSVLDPVKEIERVLSEEYRRDREEWEDRNELASFSLSQWRENAKKAVKDGSEPPAKPEGADAGPAPVRARIGITDITTEKVADLLSSTWRGLLLARDELSGWLSSMDRYNGGGDRPFWLEAYGGRSYTIDRKNSPEPIIVDHLSVAIVGGTQPDKLSDLLLKTSDDGLLARFMVVFPDPVPITRPGHMLDEAKMVDAMSLLRSLSPAIDEAGSKRPYFVHFSEPAANVLQEFRKQVREWEADATGLFKSHIGKMPGMVVRMACNLAHLDWAADRSASPPSQIDTHHVGRACDLVGDYLKAHAYRAYGTAKAAPEVVGAKVIARIIQTEKMDSLKVRDIQHRSRAGLTSAKEVSAALKVLVDADWLREVRTNTGGRPSVAFSVNPKLKV